MMTCFAVCIKFIIIGIMPNNRTIIATIGILISLLGSPSIISTNKLLSRLYLPSSLTGPDSLAFDNNGEGPYTGVSDGRILKYDESNSSFTEFAYVSPNRDKTLCNGISDFSTLQEMCGRPLGLSFNYQTGDLYIVDAYFGLLMVGSNGGVATQLVADVQGTPFGFLASLDVDPVTGIVYFTEASSNYKIRDIQKLLNSTDNSGSLFMYDPTTDQTTLLLRDLAMAMGVAVSEDNSFVLVSEYLAKRILRLWLTGPRADTIEIFLELPGRPNHIKRNSNNEFWVALNYPVGSPPPPVPPVLPLGLRVSEEGVVLRVVSLLEEFGTESVSEVQEFDVTVLYTSSLRVSYINVVSL